jgi:hypothetical protein
MPSNYVLLRKITLTQATASITFSNIPSSGYTDLKFTASARTDAASLAVAGLVAFNGITTDFTTRYMYGTGSATVSASGTREFGSMPGSTTTANTFSNSEVIIPNYLSSNVKGYSVDTVTENDGTEIYAYLFAGVWADTTAINSITYSPASGSFVAGSSFCLYGVAQVGTTPEISPFATGGDTVTNDGTYWYHAFLSSGTFTPAKALTCDYLVVAGGGGGAPPQGTASGGGGAGGYRTSIGGSPLSLTAIAYPVTVGAGGAGTTSPKIVANGNNSAFSTITSTGGGGGGIAGVTPVAGGNGGSGGGAPAYETTGTFGLGNTPSTSPSQGNNGGDRASGNINGSGGGGGAGAAGQTAPGGSTAGAGGIGSNSASTWASATSTGVSGYYAGGGGGGAETGTGGAGGTGGGGAGSNEGKGTDGTANTGGGGGGSGNPMTGNASSGGSGIVIVRYAMV